MTSPELLAAALALPSTERTKLAQDLIRSFDGPDDKHDERAEAGWLAEAERRLDEAERGDGATVPWETVKERVLGGGPR